MAVPRILLPFRQFSPPFYGGASIYIHELFSRLSRFRVTVSTNHGQKKREAEVFTNGRVVRHSLLGDLYSPALWKLPHRVRHVLTFLMMVFWNVRVLLLGLVRRHQLLVLGRPDFIIPAMILLRWLTRTPMIMVVYGEEWYPIQAAPTRSWTFKRKLFNWCMERTDGIVTLSRRLETDVAAAGWTMPMITIHPGVDADLFRPTERKDELREQAAPGADLLMLSLSRLVLRKGHDTAIRALGVLRDELPGLQLIVGGAGPAEDELKALAAELNLDERVRFTGHLGSGDSIKLALFQAADIFALPNRPNEQGEAEGFGIVYIEASACGVPVIAGDDGGVVEAVSDGESGIIVDGRSVDETVTAIRRLAGDAALRARLGEGGRNMVEQHFRWADKAARLETFFDQFLDNSGQSEKNR